MKYFLLVNRAEAETANLSTIQPVSPVVISCSRILYVLAYVFPKQ
jgi:hypothetical protein